MELAGLEPATSWVRCIWWAFRGGGGGGDRRGTGQIVGRASARVTCSCVPGVPCDLTAGLVMSGRSRNSLLYELYFGSPLWRLRRWWWFMTSDRRCARCAVSCCMVVGRRP